MPDHDSASPRPDAAGLSRRLLVAMVVAGVLLAAAVVYGAITYVGHWEAPRMGSQVDAKAAQRVEEYFAGDGARWTAGLKVQSVSVTKDDRGRTLNITFVSNGSDQANGSLTSLFYGWDSNGCWIASLNAVGLELVYANVEFHYPAGWVDRFEMDIAHGLKSGSFRLAGAPELP